MSEKSYSPVKFSEIRVGDKIAVFYADSLFTNLEVIAKDYGSVETARHAFASNWNCKYFLIERPKSLPTKLGSVVKAVGVEWVLCDPDNADPWFSPEAQTWLSNEDFAGIDWEEVV